MIRILRERLQEVAGVLPVKRAVLFGSYAKGNYTVASDVDLFVLYTGPERPDAYALVKTAMALPRLEPHVYHEGEYELVKPTVDKMLEDGVVIYPPPPTTGELVHDGEHD